MNRLKPLVYHCFFVFPGKRIFRHSIFWSPQYKKESPSARYFPLFPRRPSFFSLIDLQIILLFYKLETLCLCYISAFVSDKMGTFNSPTDTSQIFDLLQLLLFGTPARLISAGPRLFDSPMDFFLRSHLIPLIHCGKRNRPTLVQRRLSPFIYLPSLSDRDRGYAAFLTFCFWAGFCSFFAVAGAAVLVI